MKLNFITVETPDHWCPAKKAMLKYVQAMKDGDVIDFPGLAEALGYSIEHIAHGFAMDPEIKKYCAVIKSKKWFGNLKTAAETRKQFPSNANNY